ncbi:hypothetical protein SFR_0047 [Streptomyces sp. FR-008]|nr:hypothetical protein SFR_0047 [Streptomyces sp. FR-008]
MRDVLAGGRHCLGVLGLLRGHLAGHRRPRP